MKFSNALRVSLYGSRSYSLKKFNFSTTTSSPTILKEVPILPYLGSTIPQYSNTPAFDPTTILEYYPEVRRKYGDFYKIGLPGFGKGRDGIMYILNDPHEMMKIIRQEKTSQLPYPLGVVQMEWPLIRYFKETNALITRSKASKGGNNEETYDEDGFFGRGESWKHLRIFLQTDLLSPQSSKRFIPGMVQAAKIASHAAPASKNNMNDYFNRCAFDMFNSLMFGEMTKTADLKLASQENIAFCNYAVEGLSTMMTQMLSPYEQVVGNILGVQTKTYKRMCSAWEGINATAESKYQKFRETYENDPNSMSDLQKDSYVAHAIVRQKESNGEYTDEDLAEIVKVMLSASVDTTSSPMAWNLFHVAVNQDVQAKLYDELSSALHEFGEINEEFLHPKKTPYLHAVIRESHRITPATPAALTKENSFADVEIHDTILPQHSKVLFDAYSIGMDPTMMENPTAFQPERWLEDAVEARKGTPSEILDHPFFKSPFSHGSRKCPGSRVAQNEILILLSQIILDWKVSAPSNIKNFKDMKYTMSGMIVPEIPSLNFESRS